MEKTFQFTCSPEEIKQLFIDGLREYEAQKAAMVSVEQTFSINEVAKRLYRSHATIVKLIREGVFETTSDQRRVKASSVNDYLKNNTK
jgi:hypothetical protein